MRGAYTAGIYDYLIDKKINFDYCLGISAGSGNMCNYLSGQRGRNLRFYLVHSHNKKYVGLKNFLRTGSYINLDYLYSELCSTDTSDDPLDFNAIKANPAKFYIEASNALTGKAHYFTIDDMAQNNYDVLKASCSLPDVNKPCFIGGVPYFDGGVSIPIPYKKAFADGCEKLVVLLTRPIDYRRSPIKHKNLVKMRLHKYPEAYKAFSTSCLRYNRELDELKKMSDRVLIVAPSDICGMTTLKIDNEAMKRMYKMGYADGEKIADFLRK